MKTTILATSMALLWAGAVCASKLPMYKNSISAEICANDQDCLGEVSAISSEGELEQYLDKLCTQDRLVKGCIARAVWVIDSGEKDFTKFVGTLCSIDASEMSEEELKMVRDFLGLSGMMLPTRMELKAAQEKCARAGVLVE